MIRATSDSRPRRPQSGLQPTEPVRPLGIPGRIVILVLDVAGVLVAAPSGFGLLWFLPFAGVGTLLVFRRPSTSIGWLLLTLAWVHALTTVTFDATVGQFVDGSLSLPARFAGWLLGASGGTLFLLYPVLMLVFPSGRLPRRRWGTIGRVCVGIGLGLTLAAAFGPTINVNLTGYPNGVLVRNPFAVAPDSPIWQVLSGDVTFLPLIALMVGAAVSLVVRFRHAVGIERQQLRWMGASVVIVVVAVVGGLVVSGLAPGLGVSGVVWIPAIVAFPTIPIAIGIAVLRYRLYEIDRIVSRTISYAAITAVLVAVFGGAILVLQEVLAPMTGGNSVAVAASTLLVAALFQPLRRRVQAVVDRRFNRARYDAERTVEAFAERLRDETNVEKVAGDLATTASATVAPSSLAIWLRPRSVGR